jgi:hypothetical protein
LATASAPIMPLAPLRFSITTGCPRDCCSGSDNALASTSGELPGGKLTMTRIGLAGHPSGPAARATGRPAAPAIASPAEASSLRRE